MPVAACLHRLKSDFLSRKRKRPWAPADVICTVLKVGLDCKPGAKKQLLEIIVLATNQPLAEIINNICVVPSRAKNVTMPGNQ
jgi:hypothetical protein